ncbi:hypothetical protein SAMN04487785_1116 [Dyella jiangningensis]|nr:hypothetical protein BDW41_111147 [Dyella sp. AtDHG13]SDK76370.1 hypothetical protein SAMN04487785_1116 [Dyella jiangningensis]
MDAIRRQRRIQSLRSRIAGPQDAYERCRAYPCPNRTTADKGEGLNGLYCRQHIEFYRRHGSYLKQSYAAAELRPFRLQALQWLEGNQNDPAVRQAATAVDRLYRSSGAPVEAFRLAGKKPKERARAVWARLRHKGIAPTTVLATWLAVDLCIRNDLQPDRHDEYRLVQAGKLIHRLAGGSHRRWELERADGSTEVRELHKHPVSRGRVLRLLGEDLAQCCVDVRIPEPGQTA